MHVYKNIEPACMEDRREREMAKIPARFKRFSAAFDEEARARLCHSSGSEHSAATEEGSADLSDLVDSFLERDCGDEDGTGENNGDSDEESCDEMDRRRCKDLETKKMLLSLIGENGSARRMICAEIESACPSLVTGSLEVFRRRLMSWFRQRGFDAGICKCWWEKTAQSPAGEHDYIDIISAGVRYVVEIFPSTHFTIARPTGSYASLLGAFPRILVCKEEKMKAVVRLMCAAMRESLKKREMHVPPWRRNAYMQAKWFGSYGRTTDLVPAVKVSSRSGSTSTGSGRV